MLPHIEYEEEASDYLEIIQRYRPGVKKAVEFGSGGGSQRLLFEAAFHHDFDGFIAGHAQSQPGTESRT